MMVFVVFEVIVVVIEHKEKPQASGAASVSNPIAENFASMILHFCYDVSFITIFRKESINAMDIGLISLLNAVEYQFQTKAVFISFLSSKCSEPCAMARPPAFL